MLALRRRLIFHFSITLNCIYFLNIPQSNKDLIYIVPIVVELFLYNEILLTLLIKNLYLNNIIRK